MIKSFVFMLVVVSVFFCASMGYSWTDAVEGMLMPSPRGEDTMSNPDDVMENIEGSEDESSENTKPEIEWE